MLLALLATLALAADPPRPAPSPARPLLPRSSIAAVLARRGELGIGDALARQLEAREAALGRRQADIRKEVADRPKPEPDLDRQRDDKGAGSHRSPAEAGRGGRHGGRSGAPAERAQVADLQQQLDDADTTAWLEAEQLLPEQLREAARSVAERYREALADEREAQKRR